VEQRYPEDGVCTVGLRAIFGNALSHGTVNSSQPNLLKGDESITTKESYQIKNLKLSL